jgi:type 1 glutamine amidotransferase
MRTPWGPPALLLIAVALTVAASGATNAPKPRPRAELEAALAKAPKPPAGEALRPLHIVLLADVKDHGPEAHDYPRWQKRWALLLGGKEAAPDVKQVNLHGPPRGDLAEVGAGAPKVKVTTAWKWPSDEQLETADLIAMFCYRSGGAQRTWGDRQVEQLEAYFARGGGFVAIHPATYTLRDLSKAPRVAALTGLGYDRTIRWRHGKIALKIAAPDHPVCLGLPQVIHVLDEPYWPPVGDRGKVEVLAISDESAAKGSKEKAPQPLFWTARHGKGRIFACVLGHFTWTFDDPYIRLLLLRGMAWAAGDSPYRLDPLVLRGAAVE